MSSDTDGFTNAPGVLWEVPANFERVTPTVNLRWQVSGITTTKPARLQQLFWVDKCDASGRVLSRREEWRDVPFVVD